MFLQEHIVLRQWVKIASFEFRFGNDEITVKWPEALPGGLKITPCTRPAQVGDFCKVLMVFTCLF